MNLYDGLWRLPYWRRKWVHGGSVCWEDFLSRKKHLYILYDYVLICICNIIYVCMYIFCVYIYMYTIFKYVYKYIYYICILSLYLTY